MNQWNWTTQSKVHKPHRSEGDGLRWLFTSLYWAAPSLPFSRHHQSRAPEAPGARGRPGQEPGSALAPELPRAHSPRPLGYKGTPLGRPAGPGPETRAKAAGKPTLHLSSDCSSPILTLANESTKTAGGRDLAVASPRRLDGGGARGGPCEGWRPYPSGREPRGSALARRAGYACAVGGARLCLLYQPRLPRPCTVPVRLPAFHRPVAEGRCRCGVGVRFSGRHGWLRIREPGAAGRL